MNDAARAVLFCYGTLCDPKVQRSVFGRTMPSEPGSLFGCVLTTLTIDGTTYKDLAPGTGNDRIDGRVLRLSKAQLALADAFEGTTHYVRKAVSLGSGRHVFVYVSRSNADKIMPFTAENASLLASSEVLLFTPEYFGDLIDWEGQSLFGTRVHIDKDALLGYRVKSVVTGRIPYKFGRPDSDAIFEGIHESRVDSLHRTGNADDRVIGHVLRIGVWDLELVDEHLKQRAPYELVPVQLESGREAVAYMLPEDWDPMNA